MKTLERSGLLALLPAGSQPVETSEDAADIIQPRLVLKRERVLAHFIRCAETGATADEMASQWECSHNVVAPRVTELQMIGLVEFSGRFRETRTGCRARVYVVTVAGRNYIFERA